MPILGDSAVAAPIVSLVAAGPGWRVEAYAPGGADSSSVPAPSHVVGWVLTADALAPGGAIIEPAFCADGRVWTPTQFRAAYGAGITLKVVPG